MLAIAGPGAMVQDSWLTLVAGRLIAHDGIPHHELLTVWAHGRTWIDQQWLAQLVFYRAYVLGGVRCVLALSALLGAVAWATAIALAHRRGASGLALLAWAPATILAAPWAWQARAQSFALPLFVALLGIVFADGRSPSRRVFLAVPLIALWGNLHGTALLGAGIVVLHALSTVRRSVVRSAVLGGGAVLALAANPYGFGIASYYRTMTLDPPFASFITEWKPSTPSATVAPFYAIALVAVIAGYRHRKELTLGELVIGLALLAVAFEAIRSIAWFALAALILVPPLVHVRRMPGMRFAAPARAGMLVGAVVALVAGVAAFPGAVSNRQKSAWPAQGAAALRAAAARAPNARVLADDRHSDFALWAVPALSGRVIADVRFELLTRPELDLLAAFERDRAPHDPGGAGIVVLDPAHHRVAPWLARGWKAVYESASMAVLER